ncbi:MAG: alpha/beta hydrolase [Marinicaulis sp.]|nr:alpha/beta hydrolase [Marinicaulis sp.]NNL87448.1 alpha/beta hydrolase [Marinicaulis sp.]
MHEERFSFSSQNDGLTISAVKWSPDTDLSGILQISHGLGEHKERYKRLAGALTEAGFVVYASDHRGHGETIGEGAPGDFGAGGWPALIEDVKQLSEIARASYEGAPLALLGHSMGSFAAQALLFDHADKVDACVLSGSSDMPALAQMAMSGADMSFAGLNAAFAPARTDFDWLSRDEAEVDKYIADPLCGFEAPPETTMAMMADAMRAGDAKEYEKLRSDLPIYIVSGRDDPLCGGGELVEILGTRYHKGGVKDVSVKLYDGARHELFNETNRDEVTNDLIAWLDERLKQRLN